MTILKPNLTPARISEMLNVGDAELEGRCVVARECIDEMHDRYGEVIAVVDDLAADPPLLRQLVEAMIEANISADQIGDVMAAYSETEMEKLNQLVNGGEK